MSLTVLNMDNIKYDGKVQLSTLDMWLISNFSCDFSGILETKICLAGAPLGLYGVSGEFIILIWLNSESTIGQTNGLMVSNILHQMGMVAEY